MSGDLLDEVRLHRRAGTLPDALGDILPRIAAEPDAVRRRVGQALSTVDLTAVPDSLARARVAVIGSSTLAPLVAPLLAELGVRGFAGSVSVGEYARYTAELILPGADVLGEDPDSLDAVVCLIDDHELSRRLPAVWTVDDAKAVLEDAADELADALAVFRSRCRAPVVLPTPVLSSTWAAHLTDIRSRTSLALAWRAFTSRFLTLGDRVTGVYPVDTDPLAAESGPVRDERLAAYTSVRWSDDVLHGLSREIAAIVAACRGRTSKALVLDLDGTTWGGILADDGPDGIVSGEGPVGECFTAVQRYARQLASQGVILTVASKNDESAVREVLRSNANVALNEDDVVVLAADWNPKPGNIAGIADTLGIGVDALVFVDDSASETGAVRGALPAVQVLEVDRREPALHLPTLTRTGFFTTLVRTAEDSARSELYRTQAQRAEFRRTAASPQEYLASLGTEVEIAEATTTDLARISQITLRTNQFNTTTVRMDPDATLLAHEHPDTTIVGVRCWDRFGDHGTVGVAVVDTVGSVRDLRLFAMSCRVLGRGVEIAAIRHVLATAKSDGIASVTGSFVPSPKNAKAAGLLTDCGFVVEKQDRGRVLHRHDLTTLPEVPGHLSMSVPVPV